MIARPLHPSDMDKYTHCPMQWKILNEDRVVPEFRGGAAVAGTAIHKAIEMVHQRRLWPTDEATATRLYTYAFERDEAEGRGAWEADADTGERRFVPVHFSGKASRETLADDGASMIMGYSTDPRNRDARVLYQERSWRATLELPSGGSVELAGRLDRADDRGDGTAAVRDFKSGQQRPHPTFLQLWPQAHIYAIALEHAVDEETGDPFRLRVGEITWVHLRDYVPYKTSNKRYGFVKGQLRGPAWYTATVTPTTKVAAMREFEMFVRDVQQGHFPRRASTRNCSGCAVRASCLMDFRGTLEPGALSEADLEEDDDL